MLLRNEWGNMVDILTSGKGQVLQEVMSLQVSPANGECCYCFELVLSNELSFRKAKRLYYILILFLIRSRPFVFQDAAGEVFIRCGVEAAELISKVTIYMPLLTQTMRNAHLIIISSTQ